MNDKNNILDAFLQQTYGSLDNARKADQLADKNPHAQQEFDPRFDEKPKNLEKELNDAFQQELIAKHFKNSPIKESMSIPTNIQDGTIDNKPNIHPQFKNYDHSLEQHRGHKLGLIKLHIEENNPDLNDLNSGNVNDMLDNMFSDDSNLIE